MKFFLGLPVCSGHDSVALDLEDAVLHLSTPIKLQKLHHWSGESTPSASLSWQANWTKKQQYWYVMPVTVLESSDLLLFNSSFISYVCFFDDFVNAKTISSDTLSEYCGLCELTSSTNCEGNQLETVIWIAVCKFISPTGCQILNLPTLLFRILLYPCSKNH